MRTCLLLAVAILAGMGCATSPQNKSHTDVAPASDLHSSGDTTFDELDAELTQKQASVPDPLEPVNRVMFGVNDVLYFWVVKPVLQAYTGVVPKPVRTSVRSFFHNLTTPGRLANCLLQGKGSEAGTEVNRFAINTTIGVLGFGDPARDRWGLRPSDEDLGQTLGVYGFGDGCYLVWPLLGPSTLRDSLGMVGDQFMNPVRYVEPEAVSIGMSATGAVNGASFSLGEYESLKAATVDPYVALREAYIQYRNERIREDTFPHSGPTDPNR